VKTLTWRRLRAGIWRLESETGDLWALIIPYADRHACKNQYQAFNRHPALGSYWTTGIGVTSAKRNIVKWLEHNACGVENFEVQS
jgi:hypothetical protein